MCLLLRMIYWESKIGVTVPRQSELEIYYTSQSFNVTKEIVEKRIQVSLFE